MIVETISPPACAGNPGASVATRPLQGVAGRLPSIDGWRALSILLVLGDHSRRVAGFPRAWDGAFGWVFDGNLGVRFFFVISGFLITHLLIRESGRKGRVSLRDFYIRRALRILPVYYVFLLVALILSLFGGFRQTALNWAANLTFTTNFFERSWTTGHLWSLSVEEQFYLVWPACFALAWRGGKGRRVFWMLALPVLVAPVCRLISHKHMVSGAWGPLFSMYSFLNYFDSLALGCLAAILWSRPGGRVSAWLSRKPVSACCLALALVLVPHALGLFPRLWVLTVPFGPWAQAAGFGILLLVSIASPRLFRPLNGRLVAQTGVLSYSIYIWQQLFCGDPRVFGLSAAPWMSFPWWLAPVLLAATVSYFGFEKPLVDLRVRFRK